MAGLTPKEVYQAARLATNTVNSDAQEKYGDDKQDIRDELDTAIANNVTALANSVDSDAYVDGSIDAAHLSANSVDSDAYVDGSIDPAHFAAAAVEFAALGAGAAPLFSTLTADSADIQNDTLTDSGLTVTLAVGTYLVEVLALVTTAAAADIDLKLTGTATVTETTSETALVAGYSGDATAAAVPVLFTTWDTQTEIATTGAVADKPVLLKAKLVTTVAGTLKLQFAQGTTDASNTHIDKGSYLVATRVA